MNEIECRNGNIMRANEACGKLCPFQAGEDGQLGLCCADRCMGWAWVDAKEEWVRTTPEYRPDGLGWLFMRMHDGDAIWARPRSNGERQGFCRAFSATVFEAGRPAISPLRPDQCVPVREGVCHE